MQSLFFYSALGTAIRTAPGTTEISAEVYSPPFSPSSVQRNGFSQVTDRLEDRKSVV